MLCSLFSGMIAVYPVQEMYCDFQYTFCTHVMIDGQNSYAFDSSIINLTPSFCLMGLWCQKWNTDENWCITYHECVAHTQGYFWYDPILLVHEFVFCIWWYVISTVGFLDDKQNHLYIKTSTCFKLICSRHVLFYEWLKLWDFIRFIFLTR